MAMHDFNLLSDNDVSEGWEERKDGRERCSAVYNEERHMINFKAIREVAHASSTFIGMRYNDNLVAPIDKFCRKLVNMTFDSSWLRKEEIAGHSNVVSHCEG